MKVLLNSFEMNGHTRVSSTDFKGLIVGAKELSVPQIASGGNIKLKEAITKTT